MTLNSPLIYKKLAVNESVISTYPEYGDLFAMLDFTNPDVWKWVFSNFIHIISYKGGFTVFKNHYLLLNQCPFLQCFSLPREYIFQQYKGIGEAVLYFLKHDYYVLLDLNRYYLPQTKNYLHSHRNHLTIINGFDLERNIVFAADNLVYGKYISTEYNLQDLDAAYQNVVLTGYKQNYEVRLIRKFKDGRYKFNINFFIKELELYIHTESMNAEELVSNLDIHRYNVDAMRYQAEVLENNDFEIQAFHLFYESKLLMEYRLQFLMKKGYLDYNNELLQENEALKQKFFILRNRLVKFRVSRRTEMVSDIRKEIENAVEDEIVFIKTLIRHLKEKNRE